MCSCSNGACRDPVLACDHLPDIEEMNMNEVEVFVLADNALNSVVQRIGDDQWDMVMPAAFLANHRKPEAMPTLREIINRHAYDDAWVPDMLAGRTMDEAGKSKFDGDLLGGDPRAAFAAIVKTACAAAEALEDLERTVHCSFGDYPAREYLWQINGFRGLRAWEIAREIGVDPTLPDALVQGLWDELSPVADEWRQYGVFPPAIPVAGDAPLMDRLLGLTGHEPR
jgi:hypothetical protein